MTGPAEHHVAASSISPAPTEEEAAAIVSAVEALWPRASSSDPTPERRAAWRFSGRWWAKPLPTRRDRPFR